MTASLTCRHFSFYFGAKCYLNIYILVPPLRKLLIVVFLIEGFITNVITFYK
jgi:hypothetical protein